jgi:ferredoxin
MIVLFLTGFLDFFILSFSLVRNKIINMEEEKEEKKELPCHRDHCIHCGACDEANN